MNKIDDGGPAFPQIIGPDPILIMRAGEVTVAGSGMSLRDYFAVHAPEPTQDQIKFLVESDRARNPHGDDYKPKRRSISEIIWDIRYAYADAGIARRNVSNQ